MMVDRDRVLARVDARGWGRAVLCAMVAAATACVPLMTRGAFVTRGYFSGYGYDVLFQDGTKSTLPPAWRIDNYRLDGLDLVRKDRDRYVTTYAFDNNGDGRTDDRFKAFTYALRYEHSVHAGVIWLRNIPIAQKLRDKDLRVLMQDYIEEITTATYETVQLGAHGVPTVVVERRRAAAILEQGPATVAGRLAYAATIEVANVDQIKLSPDVRTRRVEIVLMRSPDDETIRHNGVVTATYPVVVLAGYSNMQADFPAGRDDFHDFLRLLTIGGRSGLTINLAPAAPADPAAVGVPPGAPPPAAPPGAAPPPPVTAAPVSSP
jgi:hypothetical protein